MKLTHYIYISTALAALAACSDDIDPVYTVGEADNAIRLEAGVVDGGKTVQTRANWDTSNAERHGKHLALANGIKLALRVDGTWTGHTDAGGQDASSVSKPTTATVVGSATDSKHNSITMSPQLYWDDYGTADPANKTTGRTDGLTIYGAAVNDATQAAPTISDWTSTTWTLPADQSTADGNWTKNDLIISNNVKPTTAGGDGTLKFDDWKAGTANDLLEFKHVMSKITINLMANKGFPTSGSGLKGNTANKFENDPVVKLLGRSEDAEEVAYAITSGKVNIETGVVTPSTEPSYQKIITTKRGDYPTWSADTPSSTFQYTVQMSALVFPGTLLGADPTKTGEELSSAEKMTIAKLEVDGNIYYINAQKISEAINSANDYKTESGKNYILNIIVDKTEVHVNATVAEWVDVTAEPATPKIDIMTSYGANVTSAFDKDKLSFYYSKAMDAPSTDKYGIATGSAPSVFYKEDASGSNAAGKITLDPNIYWPNHSTKYFFRGVWPQTSVDNSSPAVTDFTAEDGDHQGIAVSNASYDANTFPSNLMIGIPLQQNNDGTLKVDDTTGKYIHDENNGQGISATEGKITLNFTYRMAQVEVHLMSSGMDTSKDPQVPFENNIDFGSEGGAKQAKVEIVNGYKEGYILLADGGVKFASGSSTAPYEMTPKSTSLTGVTIPNYGETNFDWTTDAHKTLVRHDAIIPQGFGTDAAPLQFKITTYDKTDNTEDHYFINIKDIKVSKIGNTTYPDGEVITEWKAGEHYVYTLNITKTQVTIEATIVDWTTVYASGDFWLGGGSAPYSGN